MKKRVMAVLVHNKTSWVGPNAEAERLDIHKVAK
jgi:hypothetical protein